MRYGLAVVVGLGLLAGLVTEAWSVDPVLQLAQERLTKLGYELGLPDGIYGPQTRWALEAFQRAQKLPVTGELDSATQQALEQAILPVRERSASEAELPDGPVRIVAAFLRAYAHQPSRALPYVSEQFLQGMTIQEWIENTAQTRYEQAYAYLSWKVERLEMQEGDTRAVVTVRTRARIEGKEQLRQEQFNLRKTAAGVWLIDHWLVEAQPAAAPPASMAGS